MSAMVRTGTKKLAIKKEGFELQLEREDNGSFRSVDSLELSEEFPLRSEMPNRADIALSRGKEFTSSLAPAVPTEKEEASYQYVTSPMVGTFYASPSPDDPPFVKVGEKIDKNYVICIIEAMKVMNEVKAGVAGTVVEVLVESGHPVEFGTKLFRIS